MIADFTIGFALGLAGSLHCVQMCGPVVLSLGLTGSHRGLSQLLYHAGRIATYSALGATAGAIGQGVSWMGGVARFSNAAALLAGIGMLIAGVLMFGFINTSALVQIGPAGRLTRGIGRLLANPGLRARLATGLLMGLLPCGLVYAALLKAVSTGDAAAGAVTMGAFGLGTAGPLLGIGWLSAGFSRVFGQWGTRLTAVAVTVTGAFLVWRGLMAVTPGAVMHHH